jgi:predicted nucleic acid-binding protein
MTKNICFVDSVCWIAILNADDELHEEADTEYKKLMKSGFHFVTSTAVLNEAANALCKPKYRGSVVEFHKRLQKSKRVKIIFVDENLWSSGWKLYENRPDKEWSLTDCISIVVMQERGIRDALTNDKHFEQAGFNAILRKKKA